MNNEKEVRKLSFDIHGEFITQIARELKGSTAAGTYHLETYEPGEEEPMMGNMNIWKQVVMRKNAEKRLARATERWNTAMVL